MADPSSPIRATPGQGGGIRRKGEARSEPERSEGNPQQSEQSHFLLSQKIPKQKEKLLTRQIWICQSQELIFAGLRNDAWKKDKKMAERAGFEPAVRSLLRRFSKPLLSATQPPLRIAAF